MRPATCPVCSHEITPDTITAPEPFACPACGELLKTVRRPSEPGHWVLVGIALVIGLQRGFGWRGWLATFLMIPIAVGVLNSLLDWLLGYELEPVGRMPLGGPEF